jgi:hypothetical protein
MVRGSLAVRQGCNEHTGGDEIRLIAIKQANQPAESPPCLQARAWPAGGTRPQLGRKAAHRDRTQLWGGRPGVGSQPGGGRPGPAGRLPWRGRRPGAKPCRAPPHRLHPRGFAAGFSPAGLHTAGGGVGQLPIWDLILEETFTCSAFDTPSPVCPVHFLGLYRNIPAPEAQTALQWCASPAPPQPAPPDRARPSRGSGGHPTGLSVALAPPWAARRPRWLPPPPSLATRPSPSTGASSR